MSFQVPQLRYALGIGGFMSFYGAAALIVILLPSNLVGMNSRIIIIALILLTLPFTLLFGWLIMRRGKKKKAAAEAAKLAAQPAVPVAAAAEGAPATSPAKLTSPAGSYNDINTGVEEVIQFLKSSNIGGGSKEAVYSLPWYIVAGPPKTGKSSLVISSDLNFQNLPSQRQSELRLVRPTTSVDWRVTSDGVFIDTAGRYQTEGPDSDEWASLLETIKKARSNRPLDGLILTVNAREILNSDERQIEEKAKVLRARIDEAIQRLKVRFPVYLIFTNADAIEGFSDSFSASKKENKELVWGATIPIEKSENAQSLFDSEFEILHDSVMKRRLARLSAPFPPVRQLRIFNFPLHFGSARRKCGAFVNAVFRPSPFSQNPFLRGFYFTASPQSKGAKGAPVANGNSFFTERLFRDVILRDRDLVKTFQAQRQRPPIFGWFLTLLLSFIVFVLLVMSAISLYFNKTLLDDAKSKGQTVVTLGKTMAGKAPLDRKEDETRKEITAEDDLRQLMVRLDDNERNGAPFYMRFGLYSGNSVYKRSLLPIYMSAVEQRFKAPTIKRVEAELKKFVASQPVANPNNLTDKEEENLGKNYDLLKAYLMLSGQYKDKAEASHIANTLKDYWVSESKIPTDLSLVAQQQLEFWAKQVDRDDNDYRFPRINPDAKLVDDARKKLQAFPAVYRYYKRKVTDISKEIDDKVGKTTLDAMLARDGADAGYLEGSYAVPSAYTRPGLDLMTTAISEADVKLSDEDWVMGESGRQAVAQSTDASKIQERYYRDYADHWRNFVKGVTVRTYKNKDDAANALQVFSSANSPMKILAAEIAKNTNLSAKSDDGGLWAWIKSWFTSKKSSDTGGDTPPEKEFRPLFTFVGTKEQGDKAPVEAYRNEIGKLYNDVNGISQDKLKAIAQEIQKDDDHSLKLRAHEGKINDLLKPFADTPSGQDMAALLQKPIGNLRELLGTDAKAQLIKAWSEQILPAAKEIETGYPFQDGATEADLTKITAFLNPNDGKFSKFYDDLLKRYFDESNGQLKPKDSADVKFTDEFIAYLNNALALRKALFGTSPTPKFEYEFSLQPVQGSPIEITIDGQKATSDATGSIKGTFPASGTDTGVFMNSGSSTGPATNAPATANSNTAPGKPGSANQPSAGDASGNKRYPGNWGLFRFVDDGKPQKQPDGSYLLTYSVGGRSVTATIKPSGGDLFDKSVFKNMKAPQTLIK
jgi:type VI secretion system protein ImpL